MLIKALSEYYDILANAGKVLPSGYFYVDVNYLICLTPDGGLDEIIDCQRIEEEKTAKGKIKQRKIPKKCVMPRRTEKTGIDANIPEHRPVYIFGLNLAGELLSTEDPTGKAKKSHEAFVAASLNFLDGIESPLIHAYRLLYSKLGPGERNGESQSEAIREELREIILCILPFGSTGQAPAR